MAASQGAIPKTKVSTLTSSQSKSIQDAVDFAASHPDHLRSLSEDRLLGRSTGVIFAPARVYLSVARDGSHFAFKKYDLERRHDKYEQGELNKADAESDLWAVTQNEVKFLRQLQHRNVIPLLSSFSSDSRLVLVFPYMNLGSVKSLLRDHFPDGLPEATVAFILQDIVLALQYLHSKDIVHRSVRCSHFLLTDEGSAKLGGFKYAISLPEGDKADKWAENRFLFYTYKVHKQQKLYLG